MKKKTLSILLKNIIFLKQKSLLKIFGKIILKPNLWYFNRHSTAGAFAIGLLVAFIPFPSQMIVSAGLAILCSVNLPLAVALVWITNPITMPFLFYFAYKVGAFIMNIPSKTFYFEFSWEFILNQINIIVPPLLLGCMICGIFSAFTSYLIITACWRYSVIRNWNKRKLR
ncbi:flagellar biosynthesis protein FlhF [Candidatus Photodesmus katoptron Akat1]|uniref:Flagellar biosynthesis protein FlhF n=1 Tax=Candidatus Photodesmus katoptron Akat1 TaxID=1236703 RepID=S3E0Y0_9GAMM|nr:DUF2062 domain-containing protein [Candidatus Photodesmus katoptron]EPE37806.1 flagellar biosynthesis protein FlhF [Candidatus Photodesmus katoptron Akat1]